METRKNFFGLKKIAMVCCMLFLIGLLIAPVSAKEKLTGEKTPADVHAVKGYIQEVIHDTIRVAGKLYDIRTAKIMNTNGEIIDRDVLTKGAEVEVHERNKKVIEVIFIREYMHE